METNPDKNRRRNKPRKDSRRYKQFRRVIEVLRICAELGQASTAQVHAHLANDVGIECSWRTVHRDLCLLEQMALIDCTQASDAWLYRHKTFKGARPDVFKATSIIKEVG